MVAPSNEMRSGENLRDFYYQSPYLRRFSTNFSNEKQSANKENISPLSTSNQWIATHNLHRSGGGATVSTTSSAGGN